MSLKGVCIFTETYLPVVGGGETQARILAEGLLRRGVRVCVLTRRSDRTLEREEKIGGVPVYRIPPVGAGQMKKWGLIPSCIPHLIRLRRDYDLIFVSGFRIIGISAVLLARFFGKGVVLKADSQGEMSGDFFANGLSRVGMKPTSLPFRAWLRIRNAILRRADAFVAINDDAARELLAAGVDATRIRRISNSVDTERFLPATAVDKQALRRRFDIPATAKVVIYTGRLVSYKGLPSLLRAWKRVRQKHDDAKLLLVGAGGLDIHNCEAELKAFVDQNELTGCVTFTGNVNTVAEYLQASDIFVLPSEDDAFPSALVEAMACGLPAVATPVGAMASIIANGVNGLLVPPSDDDALYQALDQMLISEGMRCQLGSAALKSVRDRYASESVNQKFVELFECIRPGGMLSTTPHASHD